MKDIWFFNIDKKLISKFVKMGFLGGAQNLLGGAQKIISAP